MLLVSRFRTVILLVGLLVPPPGLTHKCWHPKPDEGAFDKHVVCDPNPNDDTVCVIHADTGLGGGCDTKDVCPTGGDYSNQKISCGGAGPLQLPKCCCVSTPDKDDCSNLYKMPSVSKKLCANRIFQDSDWCKPNNVCENSQGKAETCKEKVPLMPYCAMNATTGQSMGCSSKFGEECPPPDKLTGSDMVCEDSKCCCKANSNKACNQLSKLCKLDQFKGLPSCQPTTTSTSTTPSSNPNGKLPPQQNGIGVNQPNSFAGGLLLLIGVLAAVYLRY